ncbi:nucleoside-diphosphate sugar epimerase [candidate division WWE3 bacterium RIFCSPHIGHO2_01_FULL_40_23]|nr:MAG: nucleoside-diphosphate sugar epimerase [candidate division WWE3 bacterium RIFCSPHIGHO2_01_FULL_40_23]
MRTKKILITGALGHIGANLIRNINENLVDEVLILDNLESRRYPSLYNLPKKKYKYRFIHDDILTADFDKYLKGVSVAIHLAAITDAEGSHKIPEKVERVNFGGLQRLADACLKNKVKILFPSTTSVYGSQANVVDETCKELKPQSPYAWAKLRSEEYLKSLQPKGLKFVVCRFGTIFGHSIGMRYDTAVNRFTWQAATGLPLSVWKTAWRQKRPYLDLADCVRAINFILEKDLFNDETYNVLTKNFTVEDVVKTIKQFVPKLVVNYVDSPIMNQLSYDVDDTKFRKLGFKPKGNLKRGISGKISSLKSII